ncbi:MAG: ankyrin repeat domain-containing protein [Candidatus Babeliales bacterium]
MKRLILLLLTFSMFCIHNTYGMETGEEYQETSKEEFATLETLPAEIQSLIITLLTYNENNLNDIVSNIIALSQTNKLFNEFINDPQFIDILIKELQNKSQFNILGYGIIFSHLPGFVQWLQNKLKTGQITAMDLQQIIFLLITTNGLETFIKNFTNFNFRQTSNYSLNTLRLLIQTVGINPNVQNPMGYTPLMFAIASHTISSNKLNLILFLLNLPNIDTTIQNNQGQTALDIALNNQALSGSKDEQAQEIMKILQKRSQQ